MLRNLLHFGDQTAGDICVTRGDIIAVPSTISFDELVHAFADAGHSRLPVYGESLDEVVGMIHIKDVFMANVDPARDRSMTALMREPLFVPGIDGRDRPARADARRAHAPRHRRRRVRRHRGLVTIEDVVEEIVGDIEDEHDEAEAGMLTCSTTACGKPTPGSSSRSCARRSMPRLDRGGRRGRHRRRLMFLLAGRILQPGECVDPSVGLAARSGRLPTAPDHARPPPRAGRRARSR